MHPDAFYALAPKAAKEDIDYLICELMQINRAELALAVEPNADETHRLKEWLHRLTEGVPPQYITGRAWFYGLAFDVNPHVLIPRFDTEVLVEALLKYLADSDVVLDIGCGSGAIAITLKHLMPSLILHATDISEAALQVAEINAKKHQTQIHFHHVDLFPPLFTKFQAIVSNPPYISLAEYSSLEPVVRNHEPSLALLADDDGLAFYKRILEQAGTRLCENGILALEHGNNQRKHLLCLTEKAGFRTLEIGKDLAGRDRYLILQKRG